MFWHKMKFWIQTSHADEVGAVFSFNRVDPLCIQGSAVEQICEIYEVQKIRQYVVVVVAARSGGPKRDERYDKMDGAKCSPLICGELSGARGTDFPWDRRKPRRKDRSFHITPN